MKTYDVFFTEGTYIEIEADEVIDEGGTVDFILIEADETMKVLASFTKDNIAGYREVR